jgi:hypothetical protein
MQVRPMPALGVEAEWEVWLFALPQKMTFAHSKCESRRGRFSPRILVGPLSGIFLLGCALPSPAEDERLPQAHPKSRYEALQKKSPFSLASATPSPVAPQASFASNWFVSGIARIGDQDFVTIKSRDLSKQFSLYGNHEAVDGVELASVTWSDLVGKSTVVLRKGTEMAKLEFNEAELHAQAPAPATKPPPGTAPPNAAGGSRPGVAPGISPALPNSTSAPPMPQVRPNAAGGPQPVHRRVQVIQPPQ